MRNYKTIWSLQGDEWPENNCYLGTVFFMFSFLSADKSSNDYSLFRARWNINRRENQTDLSRSSSSSFTCTQGQDNQEGSETSAQDQPKFSLARQQHPEILRNQSHRGPPLMVSTTQASKERWPWEAIIGPYCFLDCYYLCKAPALLSFIFSFPGSPVLISQGPSYKMIDEKRTYLKWMNVIKTCA